MIVRPRGRRRRVLLAALAAVAAMLTGYAVYTNVTPYTLAASIQIQATPQQVWAVLADSLNRLRMAGHYGGGASPGLAAELVAATARHPDIGEAVRAGYAQRHALARARLERAVEREGLRPDLDRALLIEQLVGPIYYRILITGAPADREYAGRLVDALLDGAFATER